MDSEVKEQSDEAGARVLTNIGFGAAVLGILVAVLVAPFVDGVWLVAVVLGVVGLLCGLSARDKSTRAGQWHGLAGASAVLGGVAVIAAIFTRL
ncbi:MAG TPA: hypothetical protein VNB94_13775 [Mycobacteriales bacterium]|nr:hypothetical protein [Mycobacteriales bacterium]